MELLIHQIWIGPCAMPQRIAANIALVKQTHPSFKHKLWTDADVTQMPPNVQQAYDSWRTQECYALASDVLRVWIVHNHGGVYMDADFVVRKGIESLELERYEAFLCNHVGTVDTFPNGVFGMTRHSPLSARAVEMIHPVENWCGPSWFGAVVKSYLSPVKDGVTHEELQPQLEARNFKILNFDYLHENLLYHDALASWYPENKLKLKDGTL